jgi:hypothetical protein
LLSRMPPLDQRHRRQTINPLVGTRGRGSLERVASSFDLSVGSGA